MMGTDDKPWLTVVGVVGQVRHNAVVEPPRAEMYIAHAQLPGHIGSAPRGMALVVQGDGDAAALATGLRAVVRGLDARLAVGSVRTMDDLAASHLATARFTAGLLSAFAALALILAVVGLYGAVSLVTDERAPEIGVRMALGAERGAILRLVLAEGVVLTAVGAGDWRGRLGPVRAHHRGAALRGVATRPGGLRRRPGAVLRGGAGGQPGAGASRRPAGSGRGHPPLSGGLLGASRVEGGSFRAQPPRRS